MGEVTEFLIDNDLDTSVINGVMADIRRAYGNWILSQIKNLTIQLFANEFSRFDMCTKGEEIPLGGARIEFFSAGIDIPIGPMDLHLEFGASGNYGMTFRCDLCLMSMKAIGTMTPELGAQLWGSVGASILTFKGEVRCTGYLFTVNFPVRAVVEFNKFPMEVRTRMDMNLVPFKIELRAILTFHFHLDLGLFEINIQHELMNILLWDYSTPVVKGEIFNANNAEPDKTPPTFTSFIKGPSIRCNDKSCNGTTNYGLYHAQLNSARSNKCGVQQLSGRDYTDPAFGIEMDVSDDRSDVTMTYCVGTVPARCNVVNNEPLAGAVVLAKKLVSGVPLFFTVYAANSAGMRSSVSCSLPTYDTTLPGGRVTADFLRSSHPHILKGSALVVDDSPIVDSKVAAGFGWGATGDQIVPYTYISINASQGGISGGDPALRELKYFSTAVIGKLVTTPFKLTSFDTPQKCARDCLSFPPVKCLAFNYDYGSEGQCELLEHIQGHGYEIHHSGRFHYFERLGIGHKANFDYRELQLVHNNLYFFNFFVNNTLGYTNILRSPGVLIDLTIPLPGHLENMELDVTSRERCQDFIPDKYAQKCVDVTPLENYRYVADGPGSTAVGNGPNHGNDLRYTRANRMIGAHWDGFYDNETGILVYTWSVGLEQCGDDIHPHKDPHHHLHDESEWTHNAVAFPLSLKDGNYHVTVRALNKIDRGGPMAVAVCHKKRLTIDTTPPVLSNLGNVHYDQQREIISFTYTAYDDLSGIMRAELGLGRSKRDTFLLSYTEVEHRSPMSYNHKIQDGVPAWVKMRVTNHVELRSTAHADRPILVDRSPPIAGVVYDGPDHHRDRQYQASASTICAAWKDFHDPESGIFRYMVRVGTVGRADNVVAREVVDAHTTVRCWDRRLEQGARYHTTVTAYHGGQDMLNVTATSSGVLVDVTPPVAGSVKDGPADQPDVRFSSEAAMASVSWHGFHDPESGIHSYQVTFLRTHAGDKEERPVHVDTFPGDVSQLEVHHLHLHHGDHVRAVVIATNGAGNTCRAHSSGFTVDLTAPNMHELSDGPVPGRNIHFTSSLTTLSVTWNYTDAESGVEQMKLAVYETRGGTSSRIHPTSSSWHELPGTSSGWTNGRPFQLELGLHYHFKVAAVNHAGLTGVHQTDGATVDNTPPEMLYVHAGAINGESEELDDGFVVHNEEEGIWGSWAGRDFESGVQTYLVAIGTQPGGTDLLAFTDVGDKKSHYMTGFRFSLTDPDTNTPVYYISVKCLSGADQLSPVMTSSPIKVVEGDKAGVVYDGPDMELDVDFTLEGDTAIVSFRGFQSARDGIARYLWAVGTEPYGDDVMTYTGYGIVEDLVAADDDGRQVYHGMVMLPLEPGRTYYATVRAITGAGNLLESCSNGIIPDNSPPQVFFTQLGPEGADAHSDVIYQIETDSVSASWNVTDAESGVTATHIHHGSYPGKMTVPVHNKSYPAVGQLENAAVSPRTAGVANMLTLQATNQVGLEAVIVSPPIMVDQTPPEDGTLQCPTFISGAVELTCTWLGFRDGESALSHYRIGMGRYQGDDSLAAYAKVPLSRQHFSFSDVKSLNLTHEQTYYITVVAVNYVGMQSIGASVPVIVDDTPPQAGVVIEMSDSSTVGEEDTSPTGSTPTGLADHDAICQRSVSQLTAAFEPFVDKESGIDRYEIAVGTSPGGAQVQAFQVVPRGQHKITLTGLDMARVPQVFVTVKGYNGAGHHSIAISNGVYISRISAGLEPLVESYVYDGIIKGKDLVYQDHNDGLSAHWDLRGDPCPVRSLRWAALRADRQYVVPFSPLQSDVTKVQADELQLTDSKTYYVTIRVTNMLGHTYSLRSNGVTVQVEPLVPGVVRDGDIMGIDLSFQPSLTALSANWDGFGRNFRIDSRGDMDTEIGYHQTIDHYEVAAGTDRRFPDTRENVRPFTDVGLNRTWTFTDLNLVPMSVTYYMTVRAYSVSTAVVEVTSKGIKAGTGAAVISRGQVIIQSFVPSTTEVSISWKDFLFVHPIILYQWAIGTYNDEIRNISCMHLEHDKLNNQRGAGNYSHLFDVHTLTSAGKDTYVRARGLTMTHGRTYHAVVIAVDQTGGCMMEGATFTVDTTPPLEGSISTGADFGKSVNFLRHRTEVEVSWKDFEDPESDIISYEIMLLEGSTCNPPVLTPSDMESFIRMPVNATSHKFMELQLKTNATYFVYLRVTNGARVSIITTSKTLLLDLQAPTAGVVVDGPDLRHDKKFQSSLTQVTGTILYLPTPEGLACPDRVYHMTTPHPDLTNVQTIGMNGDKHRPIWYQRAQVAYDPNFGSVLNLRRDTRAERMISAAIDTQAHLAKGGTYQFRLKAGSGALKAVTSVVIRNGPRGVVWDYQNETVMAPPDTRDNMVIPDNLPRDTDADQDLSWDQLDGFGLQVIANETNTEAAKLFAWIKNKNDTYTNIADLKFDPSQDFHEYQIVINERQPNPYPTDWTFTVYVDDEVMVFMSGVPSDLPSDALLQLQLWSDPAFMPAVTDPFNVPNTTAYIKDLQIPGDANKPCRFVSPFRGGNSPVEVIYAGIGSDRHMDDIVPFRRVASPCTPCAIPCMECSATCGETSTQTITFHLDGLSLPLPSDNENDTLPIYYLTTRAITGSGQVALASSNGFYIDVTPPDIELLFHVDMAFSTQKPSPYQGSNNTIMILWQARDYQSEIVEYQWAIGTTPSGTDIQPFVSVGTNKFGFNNKLEGILQDNTTYYATLRAINEAGLVQTNSTAGVTVLLMTPDESSTETSVPGTEPFNGTSKAVRSDRQDRVSVVYDAPKTEKVNGVFFSLGTRNQSSSDIFPSRQVGYNISGTVDVDADGLHLYGRKVANISDVRDRTGRTKRQANSQFFMEPGRSIFIGMEVCAVNHKCGFMNNKAMLVMRDEDVLSTVTEDRKVEATLSVQPSGSVHIQSQYAQDNVTLTGGLLSASDLRQDYGSAASNTFTSYIMEPEGSQHLTDRNLYKRILEWTETSFYLTTLPGLVLTSPLEITTPYDVTRFTDDVMQREQPRLLFWQSEHLQWKDTSQTCQLKDRNLEYHQEKGTFTVTFCEDLPPAEAHGSKSRESYRFTGPRQFTLAHVSTTFVNSPPVLTSRRVYFMEENSGTLHAELTATDPDGDQIYFLLDPSHSLPLRGNATVAREGALMYRPCQLCSGNETVHVIVKEQRDDGEEPLKTTTAITINIQHVNKNPRPLLANQSGTLHTPEEPESFEWLVDQYSDLAGLVGGYNVDGLNGLRLLLLLPARGDFRILRHVEEHLVHPDTCSNDSHSISDFIQKARTQPGHNDSLLLPCAFTRRMPSENIGVTASVVAYTPPRLDFGRDEFKVIVQDSKGAYSSVQTVVLYILENRCRNYGECIGPTWDRNCTSKDRAVRGFDEYGCLCPAGFTGRYCETDIDECASSPCPSNYTCLDGINRFTCHCETGWPCNFAPPAPLPNYWWLGIIIPVCVLIAVIIIILLLKFRPNKSKMTKVEPLDKPDGMKKERPTSGNVKTNQVAPLVVPTQNMEMSTLPLASTSTTAAAETESDAAANREKPQIFQKYENLEVNQLDAEGTRPEETKGNKVTLAGTEASSCGKAASQSEC